MLRTSVTEWMESAVVRIDSTVSDMQSMRERVMESGVELLRETGARSYELGTDFMTELFTLLKTFDSPASRK